MSSTPAVGCRSSEQLREWRKAHDDIVYGEPSQRSAVSMRVTDAMSNTSTAQGLARHAARAQRMTLHVPRRSVQVRASVAVVLAVGVACSDASAPIPTTLVGTYTLRSVNGQALPVTVPAAARGYAGSGGQRLLADTLVLQSDSAVLRTTVVRGPTDASGTPTSWIGRWGLGGDSLLVYTAYAGSVLPSLPPAQVVGHASGIAGGGQLTFHASDLLWEAFPSSTVFVYQK